MNKVSLKMASDNGADAKKLESIDNRMRRLLSDMERQGVTVDMVEGHGRRKLSLVHRSEVDGAPRFVLLGTYDAS